MKKSLVILSIILSLVLSSCLANKEQVNSLGKKEEIKIETKESRNDLLENNNIDISNPEAEKSRAECMEWCKVIQGPDDKEYYCDSICDSQVWVENNDISYCAKIQDRIYNAACYSKIAENKKDPSICENIKDELFLNTCYMEIAKKQRDPKICDLIDEAYKDKCLSDIKK